MAVGTITPQVNDSEGTKVARVEGSLKVTVTQVVPTSGANYAAGGVPITAQKLGLNRVVAATVDVITTAATVGPGSCAALVQSDGSIKLKCNAAGDAAENAANADLSTSLVQIIAWGF